MVEISFGVLFENILALSFIIAWFALFFFAGKRVWDYLERKFK